MSDVHAILAPHFIQFCTGLAIFGWAAKLDRFVLGKAVAEFTMAATVTVLG